MAAKNYTDIVSNRSKDASGDDLGTIDGVAVRFANYPCRNPNSTRQSPPFYPNWNAYRIDTGEMIAEAMCSRVGAATNAATTLAR